MQHRHLNHQEYTMAAIDDVISRGLWQDWVDLRKEALDKPELFEKIEHICQHYVSDPYAQRYHFWGNYVKTKKQQTSS